MVLLAGLEIPDDDVLELAERLRRAEFAPEADTLEDAWVVRDSEVGLSLPNRAAILSVLDDPPAGLSQLRATLLQEQTWWHAHEGI